MIASACGARRTGNAAKAVDRRAQEEPRDRHAGNIDDRPREIVRRQDDLAVQPLHKRAGGRRVGQCGRWSACLVSLAARPLCGRSAAPKPAADCRLAKKKQKPYTIPLQARPRAPWPLGRRTRTAPRRGRGSTRRHSAVSAAPGVPGHRCLAGAPHSAPASSGTGHWVGELVCGKAAPARQPSRQAQTHSWGRARGARNKHAASDAKPGPGNQQARLSSTAGGGQGGAGNEPAASEATPGPEAKPAVEPETPEGVVPPRASPYSSRDTSRATAAPAAGAVRAAASLQR